MMLEKLSALAADVRLAPFGALHLRADELPGMQSLILLGPDEPGFWAHFTASPEYNDGAPDPMNRWSERVIGDLARTLDARAVFPFGGAPYQPFIDWARRSGRAHLSPVGLLVHDRAGLMVSYRGALAFAERIALPPAAASPCGTCATQPCRGACPVNALKGDHYDVPLCKNDLDRRANDCMDQGCAVRRACPLSQNYGRQPAQSAFHMRAFR
ncbi:hypothetical protein ROG8370_00962 [Roseovarius gaetbuli]|uniref:4Fe-4S ferredoxin-type domain-containing protein n=2 Tax=Roseovarius gaetbuli TaxID=1356575 RepID=A0A1X6YNM3_9RHOB|nr:hypothetical protein ROG8370_00962 [Roseovarius gaetbuli]